ncbi:MAG: RluA family pseudouridine synthase [Coriobacteriales bacterium]|nr:RluA family pseudouridine synthase [Coriobacteriales bacterium]MBQ6586456.1 RluA family pseudouridine synthase [Coriobacteriales bacterium]
MNEKHIHIVDDEEAGLRLDYVLGSLPALRSRSAASKLIDQGMVTVDGLNVSKKHLLSGGEVIEYETTEPVPMSFPIAEPIPLDIRFEDQWLLVISKQADLCCHPSPGHETGTLVNALVAHCGAANLGIMQGEDRPGLVHRLDKDTSGLMLAAKDNETQAALQAAIRAKDVDRRYLALVHGNIVPDSGLIDAPIARSRTVRIKMEISDRDNSRESTTTFKVLERFDAGRFDDGYTLLECRLHTGRTHQIRVHMDYIHHPCVGDQLYGFRRSKDEFELERQFLHSYYLDFEHPETGVHLRFLDPLPADLAQVLDALSDRSRGRTERGLEVFESLAGQRLDTDASTRYHRNDL